MRLTKLEAVNRILLGNKESPVNSLQNDGSIEADIAEKLLDQVLLTILADGRHYNTEIVKYTPDSNNEITIPSNVLSIDSYGENKYRNIVDRNGKLYDIDSNTFLFTNDTTITCKVIYSFEFEEIPVLEQFYITDETALQYQQYVNTNPEAGAFLQRQAMESKMRAQKEEMRNRDHNWVNETLNARISARRGEDWNVQSTGVNGLLNYFRRK